MPKMTGGEAAVQALLAQGVDTLFVLPGVQNDALFSALYDAAEQLRVIVTRHEQAAGYMAYGYAAATGGRARIASCPAPAFSTPPRRSPRRMPATPPSSASPARCRCTASAAASACCTSCPTSSASCSA